MIKTNTSKRGGEIDSERHNETAGRQEGGGGQTDKEWVRQADILLHVGPSNKREDNMQGSSSAEAILELPVFWVKPCKTWAYGISDKGLGVTRGMEKRAWHHVVFIRTSSSRGHKGHKQRDEVVSRVFACVIQSTLDTFWHHPLEAQSKQRGLSKKRLPITMKCSQEAPF